MRRPISSKSDTCTEGMDVYAAGISVKVGAHYPGRSVGLPCATGIERCRDGPAEVGRGHSSPATSGMKARTCQRSWTEFLTVMSRCLERGPEAGSSGRNPRGKAGRLQDGRQGGRHQERWQEPPWYGTVCPVVWEDGGDGGGAVYYGGGGSSNISTPPQSTAIEADCCGPWTREVNSIKNIMKIYEEGGRPQEGGNIVSKGKTTCYGIWGEARTEINPNISECIRECVDVHENVHKGQCENNGWRVYNDVAAKNPYQYKKYAYEAELSCLLGKISAGRCCWPSH